MDILAGTVHAFLLYSIGVIMKLTVLTEVMKIDVKVRFRHEFVSLIFTQLP